MTFPRRVRYLLGADPMLASEALREVLRAVLAYQRKRVRRESARPALVRSNAATPV